MKLSHIHLLLLRLALGALFLMEGLSKYNENWLTNPKPLIQRLETFHGRAGDLNKRYLELVAIPHAPLWGKLMTIGELATGVSFLLGLFIPLSGIMTLLMIFNFYAANGALYSWNFFGSAWSAPLAVAVLIIVFSRAGRWMGLDALLAKLNSKGKFW